MEAGPVNHACREHSGLPIDVVGQPYDLEYGQDRIEAHPESFSKHGSYAVIDDPIATGGTVQAAVDLPQAHNCKIACCAFVIELSGLQGRNRLAGCAVESLLKYE